MKAEDQSRIWRLRSTEDPLVRGENCRLAVRDVVTFVLTAVARPGALPRVLGLRACRRPYSSRSGFQRSGVGGRLVFWGRGDVLSLL